VGEKHRHAARGVAAGAAPPAIGVPDAHECIGLTRGFERNDLVAADALLPVGDGADGIGREGERASARVDHDKIVAEPVHLAEPDRVSLHGASLCRYIGRAPPLFPAPPGLSRNATRAMAAKAAPARNVAPAPIRSHRSPASTLAMSVASPATSPNRPNAVPRRRVGAVAAISAASTPCVRPICRPQSPTPTKTAGSEGAYARTRSAAMS